MPDPVLSAIAHGPLVSGASAASDAAMASTLSGVGARIMATVAPKASFVVAGIPVTATMLQWLAAAVVGMGLALIFARRRHAAIEPPMWWAAAAGVLVGRLVYLAQNWPAYARAPAVSAASETSGATAGGQGWLAWIGQLLDLRDGGMSIGAGLAAAFAILLVLGWRRKGLRAPLAATVGAAFVIWCGTGVALHAGAMSRPDLPDWRFVSVDTDVLRGGSAVTAGEDMVSLRAQAGQPTVVNLWATWCGPCRREMPALARAQQAYPNVHIVFANQGESAAKVQAYLAGAGLSLKNVVLDSEARLGARYRSSVVPTTLFFHADGRFAEAHFGTLTEPALHAVLDTLQAADRRG